MTVEEKRSLLNMAELWTKKTMENSSIEGSTHIRNELRSLQLEWDALMTSLSNRRASLESVMLRWSDLDKDVDMVQRWMLDVRRHLLNTEPKSDLSEKMAHLQRTKVTTFQNSLLSMLLSLLDINQYIHQSMIWFNCVNRMEYFKNFLMILCRIFRGYFRNFYRRNRLLLSSETKL